MNVITANVGQGSLSIVRHRREAIIIDSRIPRADDETVCFVKELFAVALKGHCVKGLILTGFDDDHSDNTGVCIVLRKYRPEWVMYPRYYKNTTEAKLVFAAIRAEQEQRKNSSSPLRTIPVRLDQFANRKLSGLSAEFEFELFSPHIEDMDSSNNCSLVLKLSGVGPGGFSYLITGDTENDRWDTICKLFNGSLKSHVMAAPHHGSRNGTHPASLVHIAPHTVLISAGVDSQYGHPHPAALRVYSNVAKYVFSTNMEGGVSLLTQPGTTELTTKLIHNANV